MGLVYKLNPSLFTLSDARPQAQIRHVTSRSLSLEDKKLKLIILWGKGACDPRPADRMGNGRVSIPGERRNGTDRIPTGRAECGRLQSKVHFLICDSLEVARTAVELESYIICALWGCKSYGWRYGRHVGPRVQRALWVNTAACRSPGWEVCWRVSRAGGGEVTSVVLYGWRNNNMIALNKINI